MVFPRIDIAYLEHLPQCSCLRAIPPKQSQIHPYNHSSINKHRGAYSDPPLRTSKAQRPTQSLPSQRKRRRHHSQPLIPTSHRSTGAITGSTLHSIQLLSSIDSYYLPRHGRASDDSNIFTSTRSNLSQTNKQTKPPDEIIKTFNRSTCHGSARKPHQK